MLQKQGYGNEILFQEHSITDAGRKARHLYTSNPICGLVQIPCVERNGVATMRAINAVNLANFLVNTRIIPFDLIVKTMYETGIDLLSHYRKTSTGGMAKLYSTE